MDREKVLKELITPFLVTLILWAILLSITGMKPIYLALSFAGIYIIVSNLKVLASVMKVNPRLSGGAVAHIGIGLVLIGILFSAGYSQIVSLNNTGLVYIKEAGTEFNRDNLLLFLHERRTMADYDIEFLGERIEPRNKSGYVKKSEIDLTVDPYRVVAKKDIFFRGKKLYSAKDTFEIYPENTFYEIELSKNNKVAATLFPRVQINPAMGGFIASPDISRRLTGDLYSHVSAPMDASAEVDWGKTEEVRVTMGQKFYINDYVASLEEVKRIDRVPGTALQGEDVAVQARIKVEGERDSYYAEPIFLIKDRTQVGRIPSEVNDLGIKVTLLNIHPDSNEFSFALNARQKDWVIIKAMEKPYINVLWLGTGVLMIGFVMAMRRRFKEFGKTSDR
jgi:cytochrome c-type biogenesis protein CcmF